MTTKKKFVKVIIIFILVFFVTVTWLSMIVPYIGGAKNVQGTGELLTGDVPVEKTTDWMGL